MKLFSLYDHPAEFPDHFAVRQILVADDGLRSAGWVLFSTAEAARSMLARLGLLRVPRGASDEPKLLETWV